MWMAYDQLEPFGEIRGDIRAAIGHSLLYNIHRSKNTPSTSPKDWLPRFQPESKVEKIRASLAHRVIKKGKV